jgi:hypothetical protein
MADKNLAVYKDASYKLRWTVPPVPQVTTAFVNADGTKQEFSYPDPPKEGETPSVVTITVKKGPTEGEAQPDGFKDGRPAPVVAEKVVDKKKVLEFSAVFQAREVGVFVFTVEGGPQKKTVTQAMKVTAPLRTIDDVLKLKDTAAGARRLAILAAAADFFPAFNICDRGDEPSADDTSKHKKADAPTHQPKLELGADSGRVDQGPWVTKYGFCSTTAGTSCTSVNPRVVGLGGGSGVQWSFNAPQSPGWVAADRTNLPSVGDTYLLMNDWEGTQNGHVGLILHVPPNGNGLWITADGGQGTKPEQLALLIPRWGLLGAVLPAGGNGHYAKMAPEPEGGPFLSGATPGEIDLAAKPMPAQNDDVAGIIRRVKFNQAAKAVSPSNPRRMAGFVDVDNPALKFKADGQTKASDAVVAKVTALKAKVDKVIAACLAGKVIGGAST